MKDILKLLDYLAPETQLVAFETIVAAGLAEESESGHNDLGGEEDHPEAHALIKARSAPKANLF